MKMKPITVIGGGLAGLTLGIGLRRCGAPATVWEAGSYPRHRVCGEFISGKGVTVLDRLGLRPQLEAAGAVLARTVRFYCGPNRSPVRRLPAPALCLSRYAMEAVLADVFRGLGGELRENSRQAREKSGEGLVLASGRRPQPVDNGWRWFGLKAHASRSARIDLDADLEMHISRRGYVGISRIEDDAINVCGLFRARSGETTAGSRWQWLRGEPGSMLDTRLRTVQFDPGTCCAIAGLSLAPQRAATAGECRIGDALTMTPPITGNGMSMAFESAELAVEPALAYSRGGIGWPEARRAITERCDAAFRQRLAWAGRLQHLMFSPLLRGDIGRFLLASDQLWHWMFTRTR